MLDEHGRDINYLRISVTDRCNLRCVYCMPESGLPLMRHEDILSFERIRDVARAAYELDFRKFRLTGGEPLVRNDIAALVGMLRAAVPGAHLAMTTNGTLLAPLAEPLRIAGLDSVNVSLDTLDPSEFARLTRGGVLSEALSGIDAALAAGLRVKLNVVVSDGVTDAGGAAAAEIRAYAAARGAAVQLIREYRLDEPKRDDDRYDRPPRCGECNRIRLSSDGRLKPCLHSDEDIPVDFSDIRGSLMRCIRGKPPRGAACAVHALRGIGG